MKGIDRFRGQNGETIRELAQQQAKNITLGELYSDSGAQVARLEKIHTTLSETSELCDRLLQSPDPNEDITRLIEILIQKDEAWAESEMHDDPRMLLFYLLYDQRKSGGNTKTLSYEMLYKELQERRFDEELLSEMTSSLKTISNTLRGLQSKMSDQLAGEKSHQQWLDNHRDVDS